MMQASVRLAADALPSSVGTHGEPLARKAVRLGAGEWRREVIVAIRGARRWQRKQRCDNKNPAWRGQRRPDGQEREEGKGMTTNRQERFTPPFCKTILPLAVILIVICGFLCQRGCCAYLRPQGAVCHIDAAKVSRKFVISKKTAEFFFITL